MDISTFFDGSDEEVLESSAMNIAIAQLDSRLGDIGGNVAKAIETIGLLSEQDRKPDLMILPPSFISGLAPGSLVDSEGFLDAVELGIGELAEGIGDDLVVLTTAMLSEGDWVEEHICLLVNGEVMIADDEMEDEDDEGLYGSFEIDDLEFAVVVGDASELDPAELDTDFLIVMDDYAYDEQRAELITGEQLENLKSLAREGECWVLRAGCVGAQDSAIFPGGSCIISPEGELQGDSVLFGESLMTLQLTGEDDDEEFDEDDLASWRISTIEYGCGDFDYSVYLDEEGIEDEAADWGAICLSVRDYIDKNGFTDVVIGLSGGLDSSLAAVVAADALGPEHVHGALMPSMYSSQGSIDDALELAGTLGIETLTIPIDKPFDAFCEALAEPLGGAVEGLPRENLQARIRTVYIMALSNQYGWIMLNTGNKSECIAGYSTLYGDTSGAYAPFGNIYKTRLYELAAWRNSAAEVDVIPLSVLTKAPSAELRENQTDQDSLPPYDVLDGIASLYLEYGCTPAEIVGEGYDKETVNRVLRMMGNAEHKRRQEPLGAWIDGISLTDDRRWPITNAFRDAVDDSALTEEGQQGEQLV
ncbi:MAG: NAD(+) synthase [bacterium]|nr:NAD(+) synthase [bacterium]